MHRERNWPGQEQYRIFWHPAPMYLFFFALTFTLNDMLGHLHTPTALPWLKATLEPTEEEAVWVSGMVWILSGREESLVSNLYRTTCLRLSVIYTRYVILVLEALCNMINFFGAIDLAFKSRTLYVTHLSLTALFLKLTWENSSSNNADQGRTS